MIPTFGGPTQEDHDCKGNLGRTVRPCPPQNYVTSGPIRWIFSGEDDIDESESGPGIPAKSHLCLCCSPKFNTSDYTSYIHSFTEGSPGRSVHICIVLSQTPRSLSSNLKFPLVQPKLVMGSRGVSWGGPRWKTLLASSPNKHQPSLCQLSGN